MENSNYDFENKDFNETLADAKVIAKEQLQVLTSETEKLNKLLAEIERLQQEQNKKQ